MLRALPDKWSKSSPPIQKAVYKNRRLPSCFFLQGRGLKTESSWKFDHFWIQLSPKTTSRYNTGGSTHWYPSIQSSYMTEWTETYVDFSIGVSIQNLSNVKSMNAFSTQFEERNALRDTKEFETSWGYHLWQKAWLHSPTNSAEDCIINISTDLAQIYQ